MESKEQLKKVRFIFDKIVPFYDFLNYVLSFGKDIFWRRFVAEVIPLRPFCKVLDLATGTGDLALTIANRKENPIVFGLDLMPSMLNKAYEKMVRRNCLIQLLCGDATSLPFLNESFDIVTMAFGIRNIPNRKKVFSEIFRVLKPNGIFYILEFGRPRDWFIKKLYKFYLEHGVPFLGGIFSGYNFFYEYLAETIVEFPDVGLFQREICDVGFEDFYSYSLSYGITYVHVGGKTKL